MVLAAPGMKGLADLAGEWAVLQGRKARDDEAEGRARVEVDQSGGADVPATGTANERERKASEETDASDDGKTPSPEPSARSPPDRMQSQPARTAPPHASAFDLPHHPSSTTPNLYSPPLLSTPSPSFRPKGDDPFSQQPSSPPADDLSRPNTPPRRSHQPFQSVPELSSRFAAARRLKPNDRQPPADSLLATYSLDAQRQLLRSHYCRTQVRFLLLLEDISNRLLVVPKPARVSALRAELTSLNHNLPAEVSWLHPCGSC